MVLEYLVGEFDDELAETCGLQPMNDVARFRKKDGSCDGLAERWRPQEKLEIPDFLTDTEL